MLKLLARGNEKLDRSIFNWSITPIKSCMNCQSCKDTCYAVNPYKRYPAVKLAWDRNFKLAKTGEFVKYIVAQLNKARTCKYVRLHTAGDFFSQDYINHWITIVKQFPTIKFYTYTKVYDRFDFSVLESLDNFNLVQSITPGGGINYGDSVKIKELVKQGYRICPVTLGVDSAKCGKTCTMCMRYNKVGFKIH